MQHNSFDSCITSGYAYFMKAYLNASEIAKLLRVNRATVSRWAKKGVIQGAIRPTNTRQWRIPLDAYDKIVKSGKP